MVTEARKFATLAQFKDLQRRKKQGWLGKTFLSEEMWLSNWQARELGYDVAEGEPFRLTPGELEEGQLYGRLPVPGKPGIERQRVRPVEPLRQPADEFILPPKSFTTGARPTTQREAREFEVSQRGLTVEQIQRITDDEVRKTPPDIVDELRASWERLIANGVITASFDTFLRHERSEKAMLGAGVPSDLVHDIAERLYPVSARDIQGEARRVEEPDVSGALRRLFPELFTGVDPLATATQEIERFIIESPEGLVEFLRQRGRTSDTESFIRFIGGDEQDIEEILGVVPALTDERLIYREYVRTGGKLSFNEWGLIGAPIRAGDEKPLTDADIVQMHAAELQERLGFKPVPPPKSNEERQQRIRVFRDYRQRGGELAFDLWQQMGMPSDITVEIPSFKDRQAVYKEETGFRQAVYRVIGEGLLLIPQQMAASVLRAFQGSGGASVNEWENQFIKQADVDLDQFVVDMTEKYGEDVSKSGLPFSINDLSSLPKSISFSLVSMGTGLAVGLPIALIPVPGMRAVAWGSGATASGAVVYSMTTYEIMQEYLEAKNEGQIAETGEGLTPEQEEQLKADFEDKAREYGLWEAVPEAISNLAFGKILTTPLRGVVGKSIATRIVAKLTALYGEEFLTETITQKGQSAIEIEAGLRAEEISWVEAFKEVAPQTFLLTTILGGMAAPTVSAVAKIRQSLKAEIGEAHSLYQDIEANINEEIFDQFAQHEITDTEELGVEVSEAVEAIEVAEAEIERVIPPEVEVRPPVEPVVIPEAVPEVVVPPTPVTEPIARVPELSEAEFDRIALADEFHTFRQEILNVSVKGDVITEAELNALSKRTDIPGKDVYQAALISDRTKADISEKIKESVLREDRFTRELVAKPPVTPEVKPVEVPAEPPAKILAAPPVKVIPSPEEISKTRQTIMSWVKQKGLTQQQYRDIFMEKGGHRQLHLMTPEQLESVLSEVRVARPKVVKGKRVVTLKTERKIQTLKDTLIKTKQLTDKSFDRLVEVLGLRTTKYESATKFITESEAKTLIRAMNDEAVLAAWDIKVEESLDAHPDIKIARDAANARSIRTKEVDFDGKPIKIKRGNELRSMRYYVLKLQKEMDAPIYDIWQKINMAHLALRRKEQLLIDKLEASTPEFRSIVGNKVALTRIEDFIASKHAKGPKAPTDITAEEIKVADELESQLFGFRNDVRFARFMEAYAGHGGDTDGIKVEIPDAPGGALRRAIDIFEGKGAEALRTFLDTQEWGVIRSGYNPLSVVKPKLHLFKAKATTFSKGHIQTREGTVYSPEDRDILSRYRTYTKQMLGLTDLAPLVRAFDRVFTEHATKLDDFRPVSNVLSRGMNEMKGYREDGGFINYVIERMYAQVASAVFWRPDLSLRNKFQNFAFNPDYHAGLFLDPRNKPISAERRQWFEIFVTQQKGIEQDYLLYQQEPLPGFGRLTRLAHKTSLYPWSDKSNRAEAFYVRINKVDRALNQFDKDGDVQKLIKNSGLLDFEARQQAEALELLAMDSVDYGIEGVPSVTGKEAFARYNTQQLVNNVHFLYDRAQRAPAEMGATGKTLGNILVFTRSWGERLLLQGGKIVDPKVGTREKILAMRIVVGILVAGMLAGETYKRVTGKSHNPYNPLNILSWTPGGLMLGAAEDISNTIYWITEAATGSEKALSKLPGLISGATTLFLPFYKNVVQAIDALTDKRNIDILAMRKIREMLDDEYEVRGGIHEVERTLLEKLQRAFLGARDEPVTPQEKVEAAEELLGTVIEEEVPSPFSLEDPDIYDMKSLNTKFGQILRNVKPEDITKENDYSDRAIAWKDKEAVESLWKLMPNQPLYTITELDEELAGWARKHKRELELIRKYNEADEVGRKTLLEEHPELKVNPAREWLKGNAIGNARLAVFGQEKILSLEAYNEFKRLIKELDIPEDAIPEKTLPPEGSVDNYFKLQDVLAEPGRAWNSWESQLIYAQDDALREFLGYDPVETPIPALELKVKNRELTEERDELETDEERETWDADHTEWLDDQERVKAYENNGEEFVEQWVERGRVSDEFGGSSVQTNVWYLDNMEAYRWAFDNELMEDDGGFPDGDPRIKDGRVNDKWNIPVKRIKSAEVFHRLDEEREALSDPDSDTFIASDETIIVDGEEVNKRQWTLDQQYVDNPDFHDDMRRIEVFSKDVTDSGTVEGYVTYMRDVVDVHGANGWQAFLARHRNAKVNDFLVNEKDLDPLDLDNLPIWEFEEKWETEEIAYQDILDNNEGTVQTAKTKAYLADNLDYHKARRRIDALKIDFPIERVDNYVTWFTDPDLQRPTDWENREGTDLPWYGDDWFLIDNPEFLKAMIKAEVWEKRRDFRLVPMTEDGKSDRVVGALYLEYKRIVNNQSARDLLRLNNPNLDKWGVSVGIWTRTMSEKRRRLGLTATERFLEEAAEARGRIR